MIRIYFRSTLTDGRVDFYSRAVVDTMMIYFDLAHVRWSIPTIFVPHWSPDGNRGQIVENHSTIAYKFSRSVSVLSLTALREVRSTVSMIKKLKKKQHGSR